MELPTGTVTFLLTDIEGSTRLWEQTPDAMSAALVRHDALADEVIAGLSGTLVKSRGEGDSLFAVFGRATDAVHAACALQRAYHAEPWPDGIALGVRMALHSGEAQLRDDDYFGSTVNRCARLRAIAHGGQIVISQATQSLIIDMLPTGASLLDMGSHRLRDLQEPEHVWQIVHVDLPSEFPPLRSLSTHPNNLPVQLTAFVGRERETRDVSQLIEEGSRLVTITGMGGSGKTRIALEVAANHIERYPGGVWWVDLALLREPSLLIPFIARALDLKEQAGVAPRDQVIERLREEKFLLVLDNFEQVIEAAEDVAGLLRSCPDLTIVVTSRTVLNLSVEQEYSIGGLDLDESVGLFTVRAQQARASFVLNGNRATVESVCRRLDGIPLALELAAAQVRMLSVQQIEKQLSQRFRVLVSPFRDVVQRQRTLRAAIDWSYDLLPEEERQLFARLSVFAGGFTLEAAAEVCGGDDAFLGVARLRDQSLLRAEESADLPRFRMLETLREYGLEKLKDDQEHDEVYARHARYFAALARPDEPQIADLEERLTALRADLDNLRAALRWLLDHGEVGEAGRMAYSLIEFWERFGWFREGRHFIQRCLERLPADSELTARLLIALGWLAYLQADYGEAGERVRRALDLCRANANRADEANALNHLALIAQAKGELPEARDHFVASLAIARELGDDAMQAKRLSNLSILDAQEGRYAQARAYLEEARVIYERRRDMQGAAACLCNLGDIALRQAEWSEAEALTVQSLDLFRELEDQRGIAYTVTNLAEIALGQGQDELAEERTREALAICDEIGMHGLVPWLLELRARSQAESDRPEDAVFCLVAADRLREELPLPRTEDEQRRVDSLAPLLEPRVQESRRREIAFQVAGLTKEDIVTRVRN